MTKEEYFEKFKALTRKKLGEEEFNKKTEQDLMDSAFKLITLVETVYKQISKVEYDKFQKKK